MEVAYTGPFWSVQLPSAGNGTQASSRQRPSGFTVHPVTVRFTWP